MTEEQLRMAFQDPNGASLEGCDRDAVWAGAAGDLDAAALAEVLAHIRGCGACAGDWALAREAVAAARDEEADPHVELPPPANRSLAWVALTGAAVLILVGLWALRPAPVDGDPDVFRGDGPRIEAGLADGALATDRRLVWSPVDGAVRYELTVLTPTLEVVHEARLAATEAVIPAGAGDGPVLWRVTARREDGTAVESDTFRAVLPGTGR